MKMTSDSANKMIRNLEREISILESKESECVTFVSTVEDVENDRPHFDLKKNVETINELRNKIVTLRNAIHQFNVDYVLECGLTIDVALMKMNYLNSVKAKFERYISKTDRKRRNSSSTNTKPEYIFLNYDMVYVKEMYEKVSQTIISLQTEINKANVTIEFDVVI